MQFDYFLCNKESQPWALMHHWARIISRLTIFAWPRLQLSTPHGFALVWRHITKYHIKISHHHNAIKQYSRNYKHIYYDNNTTFFWTKTYFVFLFFINIKKYNIWNSHFINAKSCISQIKNAYNVFPQVLNKHVLQFIKYKLTTRQVDIPLRLYKKKCLIMRDTT